MTDDTPRLQIDVPARFAPELKAMLESRRQILRAVRSDFRNQDQDHDAHRVSKKLTLVEATIAQLETQLEDHHA